MGLHGVAASVAWGCSLGHIGLQPRLPMVAGRRGRLEERDEVRLLLPEDLGVIERGMGW